LAIRTQGANKSWECCDSFLKHFLYNSYTLQHTIIVEYDTLLIQKLQPFHWNRWKLSQCPLNAVVHCI
jgi:hypothetical protein